MHALSSTKLVVGWETTPGTFTSHIKEKRYDFFF